MWSPTSPVWPSGPFSSSSPCPDQIPCPDLLSSSSCYPCPSCSDIDALISFLMPFRMVSWIHCKFPLILFLCSGQGHRNQGTLASGSTVLVKRQLETIVRFSMVLWEMRVGGGYLFRFFLFLGQDHPLSRRIQIQLYTNYKYTYFYVTRGSIKSMICKKKLISSRIFTLDKGSLQKRKLVKVGTIVPTHPCPSPPCQTRIRKSKMFYYFIVQGVSNRITF